MQQQTQQQQKQPAWRPDKRTRFLILSDAGVDFETRARGHMRTLYQEKLTMVTTLDARGLTEDHTIVLIFQDPHAWVKDKQSGEMRPRRPARKEGSPPRVVAPAEKPEIVVSDPLKLTGFWREGRGDENDGAINLNGEKGLIAALQKMLIRNGHICGRILHFTAEGQSQLKLRSA